MSSTTSSDHGGDAGRKRTITIDPSLQMFSKKASRKAKQRSDKSTTLKSKPFIRPNTLKKNLLDRIKKHQQKQNNREGSSSSPAVTTNTSAASAGSGGDSAETYLQSLQYLQNLSSNLSNKHKSSGGKTSKRDSRRDNSQQMQYPPSSQLSQLSQQPNVYLESPSALFGNINTNNMMMTNTNNNNTNTGNTSSIKPIAIAAASSSSINNVNMVPPMQISQPFFQSVQVTQPPQPYQVQPQEFQPLFSNEPTVPVNMPMMMAEPKWGCLKGGTKPTFRTLHNKTLRAGAENTAVTHQEPLIIEPPIDLNAINPNLPQYSGDNPTHITDIPPEMSGGPSGGIETNAESVADLTAESTAAAATNDIIDSMYGLRKQRLDEYRREHIENTIKSQEPDIKIRETKQHVVTKKYKLGKYVNRNGPVIGVLIKNRQTQHSIEKKRKELRHIPLRTITARLHKKNLLKVGSTAPPDILRELYENAVFAGDIENDGDGILLHNFLSTNEQIEN
jgi:hypothetical protein